MTESDRPDRGPDGRARLPGEPEGPGRTGSDAVPDGAVVQHLEVSRSARFLTLGEPGGELREVWFCLHGYRQLAARFLERFRPLDDGTRLLVFPEALNRFYLEDEPGPHGPDAPVGATWMTRMERQWEIRDYVRYLDKVHAHVLAVHAPERGPGGRSLRVDAPTESGARVTIHVLGFSQGAEAAARWVAYGEAALDRLILWSAALPPDMELRPEEAQLEPGEEAEDEEGPAAKPRAEEVEVAGPGGPAPILLPERARRRLAAVDLVLVYGDDDPLADPERVDAARRLEDADIPFRVVAFRGGHEIDEETLLEVAGEG